MPARITKKSRRPVRIKSTKENKKTSNWLSLFRFGESYSSLILGILVVIITTVILIVLVRDRNISQVNKINQSTSSTSTENEGELLAQATASATPYISISPTNNPTSIPTVLPTNTPNQKPTVKLTATSTLTPTKVPAATKTEPTPTSVRAVGKIKGIHSVTNGENLWSIAEKYYKSGYNWVDIARANNLNNPGIISVGMKLNIPDVPAKVATVGPQSNATEYGAKITGTTYKIEKGDHLWGIAVRAFGDGYKWVEIARVNNISQPSVIQPGLILKIPRTAATIPAK